MESNYTPIDSHYREVIAQLAAQKKAVTINYVTQLKELLATTAIVKQLALKGQAEYAELSTGEEIRLDRIVRVDGNLSPGYDGYDFSNSCAL